MDLGLAGRSALVMGGSRGLGLACATALARERAVVTLAARDPQRLAQAAAQIEAQTGTPVTTSAGDLRSADARANALRMCPAPDVLITNAQGPTPGDFRQYNRADWVAAFDDAFFAPAEMIKAVFDGMCARGYGRIISISSRSVKNPQSDMPLSNGVRAALHGFLAGIARSGVARNVTINTLAPGIFDSDAQQRHINGLVRETGRSFDDIRAERERGIPAGRFGRVEEVGAYVAFLASVHAGYITGQTLLIDGGNYPGTL